MNIRSVGTRLEEIAEFVNMQQRFASVDGWLHPVEGYFLHLLAAEGPAVGEIVEIGSYVGRSTAFLASGSKSMNREKVTAIDNFLGCPELHSNSDSAQSKMIQEKGSTLPVFQENMQRLGMSSYVDVIVSTSEEAARAWHKPIRLLFIDGDHSYEASRRDFELWSKFIVPGGFICFHDIRTWPGVTRLYEEVSRSSAEFKERFAIQSIRAIQRL